MPNARDKSKKLIGFYASPEERRALKALAKKHNISLAELLRRIATGTLKMLVAAYIAFGAAPQGRKNQAFQKWVA